MKKRIPMTLFIYDVRGTAVAFAEGKFIYKLHGEPIGQLNGTHAHMLSGEYVGELHKQMIVDKQRRNIRKLGRAVDVENAGNAGHPGDKALDTYVVTDVFYKLLEHSH